MKYVIVLTLLLFSLSEQLSAQANWRVATVELTDGRILNGRVDDRNWAEHFSEIRWRQGGENAVQVLPLASLQRLTINDRRYLVREVTIDQSPRDTRFLTPRTQHRLETVRGALLILVEGPVSLYEYLDRRSNSHFFVAGNDGQPERLTHALYRTFDDYERYTHQEDNGFRGRLAMAMAACPRLKDQIRDLAYTREALMDLYEQYYNCGRQSSGYWYEPRKNALLFGPDLALVHTTPNYGKLPPELFRFTGLSSDDLMIGAHAKYRFGGRTGMATLRFGIAYHQFTINRETPPVGSPAGVSTTNSYFGEERSVHFQLGPQFVFVPTRYAIFIESYVEYHHILRYSELQSIREIGAAGTRVIGTPFDVRNEPAMGLTVGTGLMIGKATLSVRATAVRRNYEAFVLNLYRIRLGGSWDF